MIASIFGTPKKNQSSAEATNTMDELIKQAASFAGVDESQAKTFVGMVLDQIQKKSPEEVSAEIDTKIAGARALIDETMEKKDENEMLKPCMPVLEMLKNLIDQLTGGNAAMLDIVQKSGVSPEQGKDILEKVLDFLKEKLGPETVDQITTKVPFLSAIAA